jgi:hypothetical protein
MRLAFTREQAAEREKKPRNSADTSSVAPGQPSGAASRAQMSRRELDAHSLSARGVDLS